MPLGRDTPALLRDSAPAPQGYAPDQFRRYATTPGEMRSGGKPIPLARASVHAGTLTAGRVR